MHYVVLDRWSRGDSYIHRLDARVKLVALLGFLVALALTRPLPPLAGLAYGTLILVGLILSRLPLLPVLLRGTVVLPFTLTFAAISALAGDGWRAFPLVAKSYLSALAVLLVVGTTPMPTLLHATSSLGVPRMLVLVVQFVYRYLFVISDQAGRMRVAALCRGAGLKNCSRAERFRAATGALTTLFALSYEKAVGIERAMNSRGFQGTIHLLVLPRLRPSDVTFAVASLALAFGICYLLA